MERLERATDGFAAHQFGDENAKDEWGLLIVDKRLRAPPIASQTIEAQCSQSLVCMIRIMKAFGSTLFHMNGFCDAFISTAYARAFHNLFALLGLNTHIPA